MNLLRRGILLGAPARQRPSALLGHGSFQFGMQQFHGFSLLEYFEIER